MKYGGKYSLGNNLLTEDNQLTVASDAITDVEPGEATEEEEIAVLMTILDLDPEEIESESDGPLPPELLENSNIFESFPRGSTGAPEGRKLPANFKPSGQAGSHTNPVDRKNIKLRSIITKGKNKGQPGSVLLTTNRKVGDTWVFADLIKMEITKVESIIASDGMVYDGVPAECEYTMMKLKNGKLVPHTFKKKTEFKKSRGEGRWAEMAIEASGRMAVGNYYEKMAAAVSGGVKLGNSGAADITDIPTNKGILNGECGGFGKASQMGQSDANGLTKRIPPKSKGKELHHARRIALGFPNAIKTRATLGNDQGGDPCAENQSFTAQQSYAYWYASTDAGIPAAHQEHILFAANASKCCIYSLLPGLELLKYPGVKVPVLTPGLCGKELKLRSAGQDGPNRYAPTFKDIDWSKALCIDLATMQIIK